MVQWDDLSDTNFPTRLLMADGSRQRHVQSTSAHGCSHTVCPLECNVERLQELPEATEPGAHQASLPSANGPISTRIPTTLLRCSSPASQALLAATPVTLSI